MDINLLPVVGLVVFMALLYGWGSHWQARAKALEEIIELTNWDRGSESEAKFWRHHFDKEAAEHVELL